MAARFGDRIARHAVVGTSASALFGVPPISVVATLAPALTVRAVRLLPLMIVFRIVRFSVVATIAAGVLRP